MKEASGVNVPDVALEDIALFFWKFSSFDLKCISEVLVLIIYIYIYIYLSIYLFQKKRCFVR